MTATATSTPTYPAAGLSRRLGAALVTVALAIGMILGAAFGQLATHAQVGSPAAGPAAVFDHGAPVDDALIPTGEHGSGGANGTRFSQ